MSAPNSYSGAIIDILNEVAEFLEDRQDVVDGADGPRPNKAMSLLIEVEGMIDTLKRQSGPNGERMTEERAREIWKDEIQPDGGIYCLGHYIAWTPGEQKATLDCEFSADELEALVWFMRHSATSSERATASPYDLNGQKEYPGE